MQKLEIADLWKLEDYARERAAFRARVLAHKKLRSVAVGEHVTLAFEDRTTIQYQIQEMLRIERIFDPDAIAEELATYNPLIPDGRNLKATMLIEYADPDERRRELAKLGGIEHRVELVVGDSAPVTAIADEDLERSAENKTSAVHFLRFELDAKRCADVKAGATLSFAVRHPNYEAKTTVPTDVATALAADLA
jgi:hypothetical protein